MRSVLTSLKPGVATLETYLNGPCRDPLSGSTVVLGILAWYERRDLRRLRFFNCSGELSHDLPCPLRRRRMCGAHLPELS